MPIFYILFALSCIFKYFFTISSKFCLFIYIYFILVTYFKELTFALYACTRVCTCARPLFACLHTYIDALLCITFAPLQNHNINQTFKRQKTPKLNQSKRIKLLKPNQIKTPRTNYFNPNYRTKSLKNERIKPF